MGAPKIWSIQQGIVLVCVKVSEPSIFYTFQNENKSQIQFCCTFQIVFKKDQVSRSRLFRWEFPLCNWLLCVSPLSSRNPPRNVDMNETFPSSCDPQHLPICFPNSHLLFLIRSSFRVECFYNDVKRKILETLDNKVYNWRWYQVLGHCAS